MLRLARPSWTLAFGLLPFFLATTGTAATWRVTVRGQGRPLGETPLVCEVRGKIPPGTYRLEDQSGGSRLATIFEDGGKFYLGLVVDRVATDQARNFVLQGPTGETESSRGIAIKPADGRDLTVSQEGQPVLTYTSGEATKPYYFPVNGPTGASFTRAYPMKTVEGEDKDHPHQRSLWFTHGNVNGVDFWASDPINPPKPNYGRIRETSRRILSSSGAVGIVGTTDDWLGPDGKTVCRDERVVRVYDTQSARVLDFDITILAGDLDVTFGDTKEGMFGLRVASSMDVKNKKGGKITNADGITDDAAWGKASPWVDYSGPVDGKPAGIAILNHPDSFRYPTTWHVRTYGLFAANPFGWHDFGLEKSGSHTIPKGESISFRYRVVLHDGKADVANLFEGYSHPPVVQLTPE